MEPTGLFVEDELFVSGDGGYHTYRIPSLYTSLNGTVLAFCEGRRDNPSDKSPTDLLIKRSRDNGETWSDQDVVVSGVPDAVMDPCPVQDRTTGTIWLHYDRYPENFSWKPGKGADSATCWVCSSHDDGETWDSPINITDTGKRAEWSAVAHGPGIGIQTKSGRLVVPCNYLRDNERRPENWGCFITYSDDHGASWNIGGEVGPAVNESQIVELGDGRLMWNMRSYRGMGCRAVSFSNDEGISWTGPRDEQTLIEPICQASIIRVGKYLLFSNPAHESERLNMTVRLSDDGGESWPYSRTIYGGGSAYSCLASLADGTIGLLYEKIHRKFIDNPARDRGWMSLSFARFSTDLFFNLVSQQS